jgi:hypothetical protein
MFSMMSCHAVSPKTEFEKQVETHMGLSVTQLAPASEMNDCDIYHRGCFETAEFLEFNQIFSLHLEDLGAPKVVPAFVNYYQHNPEQAFAENITTVDGVRVQSPNGVFNIDTADISFTWSVNDIVVWEGFRLPFSVIPNYFDCDGIYEIGLAVSYQEFDYYRERPSFVNYNALESCETDICQQCVFYDFYPDCGNFLVSGGYKYDFDHDSIITMDDLMVFGQHYGACFN